MTSALTLTFTDHGINLEFPFASLFAGDWFVSAFFMAQSAGDLSSVPAEFIKYFVICASVFGALYGGVVIGRKGSKANPLHVEQPVSVDATVSHAPVFVHQSALDALKLDIERRTRENLRQHEETSRQLAEVIAAGHGRQEKIIAAITDARDSVTNSMLKELKDVHERLNPLSERVAKHGEAITHLKESLNQLWELVKPLIGMKAKPRP